MKIRSDFVSNSSSSSFVVISDKGSFMARKDGVETLTVPVHRGTMQFGWQTCTYNDFWSKLNWCAIIVHSMKRLNLNLSSKEKLQNAVSTPWMNYKDMKSMLKRVCRERIGIDISIQMQKDENGYCEAYIDHQSNVDESPENARMFRDDDTLYDFLANDHSYIDNSNDNGGREEEYNEATNEFDFVPPIPADYER